MPMGRSSVAVANDGAWHKIFDSSTDMKNSKQPLGMLIGCNTSSAGTRIGVRCSPMHDAATDIPVLKGAEQPFEFSGGITEIWAQAVGGACDVDWAVIKA